MGRFDLLSNKLKKQIIQLMKEAECKSVWKGLGKPGRAAGTSLVGHLPLNKGIQWPLVSSAGTAAWLLLEPHSPQDHDISLGLRKLRLGDKAPQTLQTFRLAVKWTPERNPNICNFCLFPIIKCLTKDLDKFLSSPSTQPLLGNNKGKSEVNQEYMSSPQMSVCA